MRELAAADSALAENAVAMMGSGLVCALLYTSIAREFVGLQPQIAFGYSFGELSMLAALGVWPDALRSSRPRTSAVFRSRLAGPKLAVRDFLHAAGIPPAENADDVWSSYLVLAPAHLVQRSVDAESTVFLTMINSPGEVVVAGPRRACLELLEARGWQYVRMPFAHPIHCTPALTERDEIAWTATLLTREVSGIRFYSAAHYAPLHLDSAGLAAGAPGIGDDHDAVSLAHAPAGPIRQVDVGLIHDVRVRSGSTCRPDPALRWIKRLVRGVSKISRFRISRSRAI
jgi:PfaB family protein